MSFGYVGKVLYVNLTDGMVSTSPLDLQIAKSVIGAHGLAAHLYEQQVSSVVEPRSAENALVFATAPLTGTLAPNCGHYSVATRTALDGSISCANLGGSWGPQLKFAGFDAVVLHGSAAKPVYLWIHDGTAELRDASSIWGENVRASNDALCAETDSKAHVCCIGPAGENQLNASALVGDQAFATSTPGIAAVAGFKKLKAVVVRGTIGVRVAHPAEFLNLTQSWRERPSAMLLHGTGNKLHGKSFQVTSVEADQGATSSDGYRPRNCFGCTIAFSSFTDQSTEETSPFFGQDRVAEVNAIRLAEEREFVDLGLDYELAKEILASAEHHEGWVELEQAARLARGKLRLPKPDAAHYSRTGYSGCTVGSYKLVPAIATRGLGEEAGVDAAILEAAEAAGFCPFAAARMSVESIAKILCLATGVNYSSDDVTRSGRLLATAAGR